MFANVLEIESNEWKSIGTWTAAYIKPPTYQQNSNSFNFANPKKTNEYYRM